MRREDDRVHDADLNAHRFVKPGDRVSQFDNICEVQSDKASVTITSRYDGLIKALRYKVDDVALIGDALLDIEVDDDNEQAVEAKPKPSPVPGAPNKSEPAEADGAGGQLNGLEKALATPAVRRIAMENGIELKDVVPTGKGGRVLKEDILAHLERNSAGSAGNPAAETSADEGELVPTKGYTKQMWKTMTRSLVSVNRVSGKHTSESRF